MRVREFASPLVHVGRGVRSLVAQHLFLLRQNCELFLTLLLLLVDALAYRRLKKGIRINVVGHRRGRVLVHQVEDGSPKESVLRLLFTKAEKLIRVVLN